MYLNKPSDKELEIRRVNFRIYFRLLIAYTREMIRERNDRVTRRCKIHELDEAAVGLLSGILKAAAPLFQKMESGGELEVMRMGVEEICNCKVHLNCLKEAGVDFIGDLLITDPLVLQEALHKAESVVGVRQPHLFICLRSRACAAGDSSNKQLPKGRT